MIVCCRLWVRRPFWTSSSLAPFVCPATLAAALFQSPSVVPSPVPEFYLILVPRFHPSALVVAWVVAHHATVSSRASSLRPGDSMFHAPFGNVAAWQREWPHSVYFWSREKDFSCSSCTDQLLGAAASMGDRRFHSFRVSRGV
ncbi:hypothetical protein BU14_3130s0001 [Porphyra umbilicalis]|uniref:Secreted protein n=1 Tax=Porphyra umbilicalis TaxID=2786 RepID=A0A1X6NI11_PORUM|nr:hypothetical protein BU14_3130s0001 [Porphyra umbilicalis]|eukprot:OSX68255.1 hypothetical protein BU14_3130s0001 [Porphyra umbilicalis]